MIPRSLDARPTDSLIACIFFFRTRSFTVKQTRVEIFVDFDDDRLRMKIFSVIERPRVGKKKKQCISVRVNIRISMERTRGTRETMRAKFHNLGVSILQGALILFLDLLTFCLGLFKKNIMKRDSLIIRRKKNFRPTDVTNFLQKSCCFSKRQTKTIFYEMHSFYCINFLFELLTI